MVINLKNPIPNVKGRKIIVVALAGIVLSGVGGYVLLSGGPPLNVNTLSMGTPASVLPANVPPPMVAPVGAEPAPVIQPSVVGADQIPQTLPPASVNAQVAAPVAVAQGLAQVPAPFAAVEPAPAAVPASAVPVAAVAATQGASAVQQVAPVKQNIPPANPIAAAKEPQQLQPAKAPELGAKPAPVSPSVTNVEIMAKLDSMSRELRETRTALANLQEKMHEVKKPAPVQNVPVRQAIRKAAPAAVEDHEASNKSVSVQEIRPGARLPNGEVVSKITAEGAVTNTGRVIRWGDQ